jgi:hypothetical protein
MILIDKEKDIQTLVLTLSEHTETLDPEYVLLLKSDSTRTESLFILPQNQSYYPERYDIFQIETSVFNDLNDGLYTYQVLFENTQIEFGKALIKSAPNDDEVVISHNSSNEILMYGE